MLKAKWLSGLLLIFVFSIFYPAANAANFLDTLNGKDNHFLPVDEAFLFSDDTSNANNIILTWQITPGYYLYREPIKITATNATLGEIQIPTGEKKSDPAVGNYQIFEKQVAINVPVISVTGANPALQVSYQGCSSQGYCYPPVNETIALGNITTSTPPMATTTNWQNSLELFNQHSSWFVIISFFGFGLLLTFTPCVLPMLPILASIIVGQHHKTKKGLLLSICYVLGSSTTYALIGVLAAKVGSHLTATLQQPIFLIGFSVLLVVLSLSLFGFFHLQLPKHWQTKLHHAHLHFQNKGWLGAIILGILSVLLVSPCITPPLVGALSYVSETGNVGFGALALFSLGLGMGAPLILLATVGAHWLPKSGHWLNSVKHIIGLLLLALALWMLNTLLPSSIYYMLWGILLIGSAIGLGTLERQEPGWPRFFKSIGFIVLLTGSALFIKGLPLAISPTSVVTLPAASQEKFIKSSADLDALLSQARSEHKPVMIQVTADWCLACQIMKKTTFQDPTVISLLDNFIVATVDVTANDNEDKALQKQLQVFAPPTQVFFNSNGVRLNELQLVGEVNAKDFAAHLNHVYQGENNEPLTDNSPSTNN